MVMKLIINIPTRLRMKEQYCVVSDVTMEPDVLRPAISSTLPALVVLVTQEGYVMKMWMSVWCHLHAVMVLLVAIQMVLTTAYVPRVTRGGTVSLTQMTAHHVSRIYILCM